MTFKGFQKTQDSTLTIENVHNYIKRTLRYLYSI